MFIQLFKNSIFDWTIQIEEILAKFRGFEHMKFFIILGKLENDLKGKELGNYIEINKNFKTEIEQEEEKSLDYKISSFTSHESLNESMSEGF